MLNQEQQLSVIDRLLNNFIGYSQKNDNLLQKYTDEFFLTYFDRLKIDEAVKKIESHNKELGMPEFVRLFLSIVKHSQEETLYLTISLIRLYKKIKQDTSNEKGVKFADFTNFLCNKISEADPDLIVPMKQIPMERVIPDTSKIREIDINPPPILNKIEVERPKIVKNNNKKDRKLDQKKPVAKFVFSPALNSIIALGRLSSSISLYQPNELKKIKKIIPSACKIMSKDVAILSLAYCERQKRIGCIINNIGITFWEASDNFSTQKILGSSRSDHDPKACGDKIYFFNLFNEWATTDKNTIYFWDIKDEQVVRTIRKEKISAINDICEIKHIRCLLVAYTTEGNPEQKMLVLYHGQKQVSKFHLQNSGCHSLIYNESTQLIVLLGYSNLAFVLQIDVKTFDINLVTQLKAHNSILTSVCNIPNTPMVITGDDLGYVKLWDLNYMRCLQSQKIAKILHELVCYDNKLFYADSRINVIQMEHSANPNGDYTVQHQARSQIEEQIYGIYQFFRKQEETLWIITRKQAREIRLKDGRQLSIFVLCNSEEQISAAGELFNGFVIGTSKGELSKYGLDGDRKWRIAAHESQINSIKVDLENHLIATVGSDNNVIIWSEKAILDKENNIRKKIVFKNKDINLFELNPYANLLAIGSTADRVLQIWNYDTLKLMKTVQMSGFITSIKIIPDKCLIAIASSSGQIAFLSYIRKQNKFFIQCVYLAQVKDLQPLYNHEQYPKTNSCLSMIQYSEDKNMLIAGSIQGMIYCFNFGGWSTNQNFRREYEPTPAIRRYTKQSYEHQILRNKHQECILQKLVIGKHLNITLLWSMRIHRDNLMSVGILNMEKKYASSLCQDGYCKLIELGDKNGYIAGSLKLSYPLPIKWNLDVEDYCDLKSNIHEALAVIDSILKNYGYDLTISEQINLNITSFLEELFQANYLIQKQVIHPQVMSCQFSQLDITGQPIEKSMSLKSLEAYKRLQLIKKQNQHQILEEKQAQILHYETSIIEKDAIRQFLTPSYLPRLQNRNEEERKEGWKNFDLLRRIEIGLAKETKRQRQNEKYDRENKCSSSFTKNGQGYSQIYNKSALNRSTDRIKEKTIRQILGEINTKLSDYKKNKSKLY